MFRITLVWKIIFGDESFLEWWESSTSSIGGEYEGFIFMSQQFNAPGPLAPCKSPRHASSALRHRHPETIRKTSSWWGLWTNMCMCWLIHLSIPSFVHACIHSFTHSYISINQSINQSIKRPSHHFQTTAGSSVSRPVSPSFPKLASYLPVTKLNGFDHGLAAWLSCFASPDIFYFSPRIG